jgi:agmatine deiminase
MNNSPNRPDLPAAKGFRMPAEWEPQAATWLSWPHEESDWPGKFSPIPWVYTEIVKAIVRHEPVKMLVPGNEVDSISQCLNKAGVDTANVSLWALETDRSWIRDSGPIFIVNDRGERAVLDWHFNAWAKYENWTNDDKIPQFVAELCSLSRWQPQYRDWRVVLEGGSIDVNGQGLLLTTEECLLSTTQQRNLPFDRGDYERVFADYLGVKKVLWLDKGITGDDTHGHVDDLARFVNPRTVVAVVENNPADANYTLLQENRERLEGLTDLEGGRLEVVALLMPRPIVFDGMRLPASYANFYIANNVVIVPTFNDHADRVALGTLAELFPDREVVGIHCLDLVWGLGTLHCMTQQEPAVVIGT